MSLEDELKPLMTRSLAGDRVAYRDFLERLTRYLRRHVRGLLGRSAAGRQADAEDIVQDILVAVHTRRHTYDPAYPVSGWVHAIARHKVIDHLRAAARGGEGLPIEDYEAVLAAPDRPPEAPGDVERVLAALPEGLRRPFAAVKLDGLSYAEAASAAGMSETALKVAVHRGMKRLARIFGAER